jgi:hypothetical protein
MEQGRNGLGGRESKGYMLPLGEESNELRRGETMEVNVYLLYAYER